MRANRSGPGDMWRHGRPQWRRGVEDRRAIEGSLPHTIGWRQVTFQRLVWRSGVCLVARYDRYLYLGLSVTDVPLASSQSQAKDGTGRDEDIVGDFCARLFTSQARRIKAQDTCA